MRNSRTRTKICSKLKRKILERRQLTVCPCHLTVCSCQLTLFWCLFCEFWTYFTPFSSIFINFGQVNTDREQDSFTVSEHWFLVIIHKEQQSIVNLFIPRIKQNHIQVKMGSRWVLLKLLSQVLHNSRYNYI